MACFRKQSYCTLVKNSVESLLETLGSKINLLQKLIKIWKIKCSLDSTSNYYPLILVRRSSLISTNCCNCAQLLWPFLYLCSLKKDHFNMRSIQHYRPNYDNIDSILTQIHCRVTFYAIKQICLFLAPARLFT